MNKKISALELANQFVNDFGLSGSNIQDGVRKKIERVCQKMIAANDDGGLTNLWDASVVEYVNEENGKKSYRHFFTQDDVERLLRNRELLQYLHKRASGKGKKILQEKIDLIDEAERRDEEYYEYLDNLENLRKTSPRGRTDPPGVSPSEVHEHEMYIMLKALFLRHFTPIKRNQLIRDMEAAQLEGVTDYINIIENIKRLEKPDAYYSEKPVENPAKRPSHWSVKSFKKRQPRGASKRPSKPEKLK